MALLQGEVQDGCTVEISAENDASDALVLHSKLAAPL